MNKNDLCTYIMEAATKGLLYEVSVTPKPGLVDRNNNGAHNDMDIFTFIDSAICLQSYFYDCAMISIENSHNDFESLFNKLRYRGIIADNKMFKQTGGVNTHKGAIFSLGLIAASAAKLYMENDEFTVERICEYAGKISSLSIEKDFENFSLEKTTKGGEIYLKHGIDGIRGEVKNGFPTVVNKAYPYLIKLIDNDMSLNNSSVNVLLEIIIGSQDTNIISRGGMDGLEYVKKCAKRALSKEGMFTEEGQIEILNMDIDFIEKNLSPGGAADLLAATLMLYFLSKIS